MEQVIIQNQAEVIKEEIEELLELSGTIETSILQTVNAATSFGKTYDSWFKELTVPIDPSADPAKIKLYCSQLSRSIDVAYRNHSKSKTLAFNYKLSYNGAFNDKVAVQALNRARKVSPTIETMSKVAESQLPERTVTLKRLEHAVEFWGDMLWRLKDQIGLVNTISMANGTMAKVGEF